MSKKLYAFILGIIVLLLPFSVYSISVTVPSAPGTGFGLTSTTTGAWVTVPSHGTSGNCVQWGLNNSFTDAGFACGSGSGGSFPFTPTSYGVSTSTTIGFTNGFISQASSTVTGIFTAATSSLGVVNGTIAVTGFPYAQTTTGINQALSDCGVNGIGAVYLPSGTYSITSAINVPSNCDFYGAGQRRTNFTDGSGGVLSQFFNITTKNNVSMHGFSFVGNGAVPPTGIGPADAIDDSGSTNVHLYDMSFTLLNDIGVDVQPSGATAASSTEIDHITADCTVGAPILVGNDTVTPVSNTRIHDNNVCGNDSGIAVFNSTSTKIYSNNIIKTGTIAGQGIEVGSNSSQSTVNDMQIWGNTSVGAFQSGLSIAGGATTTGTAYDNDLSYSGSAGLTFSAISTGFTLTNNREWNNKQDGLEVLAGNSRIISKPIITGNIAYDNGQSGTGYCGIELNTQSSGSIIGAQITGGALTDDQSKPTQEYGLCVNNTTSQQNSSGDTIMNIAFSGNASTSINYVNAGTMYAVWANQGATTTYTPNLFVASPDGSQTAPAYGFASNSGTGLYAINGNILAFTISGTNNLNLDNGDFYTGNGNGFLLSTGNADSGSSPTIRPDRSSSNTGFAAGAAGNLNAIVGGNEITRWNSLGFGVLNNAPKYPLDVTGAGHFTGLVDADHFVATSTTATSTLPLVSVGAPVGGSVGTAKVLTNALVIPSFSGFGALDLQSNGLIADTVDLLHIEQVNGTDSGNAVTIHGNVNGASQNSLFVDNGGHSALPSGDNIVQFTNGNATDKQGGIILKLQATGNQASGIVTLATNNGLVGFGTTSPMAALALAPASSTLPMFADWYQGSSSPAFIIGSANQNGNVGIATSTPGSAFSIGGIANFTSATTTLYSTGGIVLTGGCLTYTIGGACVGGSSGGGTNSPATSTNPLMATYVVATSTLQASFFPLASTTALSVSTNLYVGRAQSPSNNASAYFVNASNGVGAATFDSNGSTGISTDLVDIKQINGSDTGTALKVTGNVGSSNDALIIQNGGSQALPSTGIIAQIQNTNGTDNAGGTLLRLHVTGTNAANINTLTTDGGLVGFATTSPGTLLSLGVSGNASGINFSLATSTFENAGGINLTTGCFSINNVCVGGSTGTSLGYTAWGGSIATTYGTTTVASTTPLWAQGGIFASSTSATPTLAVTQSGTGAAAIFTGGNLGIGTTTPYTLLDIKSTKTGDDTPALVVDGSETANGNADIALTRSVGGTGEANIDFNNGPASNVWQLGIQNTGTNTGDFELWDGLNNPIFTIQRNTNNAAFGTTTPAANDLLTLSTSTEPQLTFGDNTVNNQFDFRSVGGKFYIATSAPFANNGATSTVPFFILNGTIGSLTLPENATTTAADGINLTAGCVTYNGGACIGGSGGSGTVTSVTAGSGLLGGTFTTSGTISLAWPWSLLTTYGTTTNATTTPAWFQTGLFASSTSQIQYATSTSITSSTYFAGIGSGTNGYYFNSRALGVTSNGSNIFLVTGAGSLTWTGVALTAPSTATIGAVGSPWGNLYVTNASTTVFSNFGTAYFGGTSTSTINGNGATSTLQSTLVIATSSPNAFSILDQYGTNDFNFSTASSTNNQPIFQVQATSTSNTLFQVDQYGHITASSTAPTPVISTCGTGSPAMGTNANDDVGSFVTGTSASACTITFGSPYSSTPVVIISDSNTSAVADISAVSTTGFTISLASALSAVTVYYMVEMP